MKNTACASRGKGKKKSSFAKSLAKASGCHVVGYSTGRSSNGYQWTGTRSNQWGTWANSLGDNLTHINPQGGTTTIPGTSDGSRRYPDVIPSS